MEQADCAERQDRITEADHPHRFRTGNSAIETQRTRMQSNKTAGKSTKQSDILSLIRSLFLSFDRIARSQSELPQVWEMLRFCGCELVAVDDGRASEISIAVRGLVGALYLTNLASKTRRGLAGKLAQGQRAGGLPYGYRPIAGRPGEHEIDRDQAAVVLRILRDYAKGNTCRDIAAALNREGIKPFRGRAWNASTIHGSAEN
ncbi:recombinase family protein [Bradyrhizobium neotropicale]|uniref:recombinase family protein n=1 Tax=Bradyrhizobium neotropicale TaxID=1497615 RepID=UPI001AD759B4|nr:recombinase family protein [Bradyrhizobium neotropicale]MBO4225822.1 hypothetical protein [Bradyrhizobium neotropicale]